MNVKVLLWDWGSPPLAPHSHQRPLPAGPQHPQAQQEPWEEEGDKDGLQHLHPACLVATPSPGDR